MATSSMVASTGMTEDIQTHPSCAHPKTNNHEQRNDLTIYEGDSAWLCALVYTGRNPEQHQCPSNTEQGQHKLLRSRVPAP